jgi:hypothetical protein
MWRTEGYGKGVEESRESANLIPTDLRIAALLSPCRSCVFPTIPCFLLLGHGSIVVVRIEVAFGRARVHGGSGDERGWGIIVQLEYV